MDQSGQQDPKQALETLNNYCIRALTWWGGIDQLSATDDMPHALIDSGTFAQLETISNYNQVVLKSNVEDTDTWNRFTHMVKGEEAHALALDDVFRTLNNARAPRDVQGIGRFIRALYDACDAA